MLGLDLHLKLCDKSQKVNKTFLCKNSEYPKTPLIRFIETLKISFISKVENYIGRKGYISVYEMI